MAAAHQVEEARGVVTIGAPAEPEHVEHLFTGKKEEIKAGEAEVRLGGRTFTIKKQFLEDIHRTLLADKIRTLRKALLIFHSPTDNTVGIDNAAKIYEAALHPKSFVSLHGADHLLSKQADADYVADVVAAWSQRYLEETSEEDQEAPEEGEVLVSTLGGKFTQSVKTSHHQFLADEPKKMGGDDLGPSPYDLLLAALGACTSMTLQMYAERKGWDLQSVSVTLSHSRIHASDCRDCETKEGRLELIERRLRLNGELDSEQRDRLAEIADKCPVHRTLMGTKEIRTVSE